MMKRNKAILCAVASFGLITAANTINVNAMTMRTTTNSVQSKLTVSEVEDLIDNIPYTITLDNKDDFEKAITAFDDLTEKEQKSIESYRLSTLESARTKLENLKDDEATAKELVERIKTLKSEIDYSEDDKGINVDTTKLKAHKYEILDIRNDYESLNYYVQHDYKQLVDVYNDFFKMECKLTEVAYN